MLQLLAEGCPTREIASKLCMSTKTVATHREKLKLKLGIHSIAGLTKYAILEGLTSSQPDN
ncbi:MAG: response regulator transcription factor [bacterium]|nr:response regulator transcription factor [bacterium]